MPTRATADYVQNAIDTWGVWQAADSEAAKAGYRWNNLTSRPVRNPDAEAEAMRQWDEARERAQATYKIFDRALAMRLAAENRDVWLAKAEDFTRNANDLQRKGHERLARGYFEARGFALSQAEQCARYLQELEDGTTEA